MGGWWLAFFFFFFFLSFSSFAYELEGAVYQSWKMPQRGSDQRQALNCILRWIFLPNTLMGLKHKSHKQLFFICLAIVLATLCAIDSIPLKKKYQMSPNAPVHIDAVAFGKDLEGLI